MKTDSSASDAAEQVLRLVQTGRLFELQDWIKHNKPIRLPGADGNDSSLLCAAVETGFHSMVEVLLRAGGWSQADLGDALELAQESKHFGIAELLESSGARPKPMDFQTCCEKLDLFMMERHLRAGTDPNQDNVFAQALSSMKARPLLGFYRQFRGEFPALDDQAALALAEAVRHRHVRWTALLAWAGADPFRQVPYDLSESFPVDRENATMAAKEAVWSGHPEILKALKLKPTASQAIELLSGYVFLENFKLFKTLLDVVPKDRINDTPRGSSSILESLVSRWADRYPHTSSRDGKGDAEKIQCLELLLDSGARWNPPPEEVRHIRRNLLGHNPRYIVQLLRLLLYTPDVVNLETFLQLCRSQALEAKIAEADLPLLQELKQLRKQQHSPNTSMMSATTEKSEPAAVAPREPT